MPSFDAAPPPAPLTLFALHALGMAATEWTAWRPGWGRGRGSWRWTCRGSAGPGPRTVTCRGMADAVAARIAAHVRTPDGPVSGAPAPWAIAGHSMGGRIAMIVARMAEDGAPGLAGLSHVILVASSTPAPEPMDDATRGTMLGWTAGGTRIDRDQAAAFVKANTAAPLPDPARGVALDALAQTDPLAWHHWLDRGSREDWSGAIGRLHTPALIVAGARDGPWGRPDSAI